jgi:long-chain acyl-CoA synthetase
VPALSESAAASPDKLAIVEGADGARWRTYRELSARVNQAARAYARLGATPGSRVAAMLPNGVELTEVGCATAVAQCAFVPINYHLKADELSYVLTDSATRVLVTSPELEPVAREATAALDCAILVTGTSYEEALQAEDDSPVDGAWATPTWMFYTSGTTGRPKGVVHGELLPELMNASQAGLVALWGFTPDDVHCLAGPGYHAGPGGYCFTSLWLGATVVTLPAWSARDFLAAVQQHRISTTFLTPAHLIRILEVPDASAYDLSSLRLIIHAGAPCPLDVKRRILDLLPHTEVSELYGASEGGVSRITAAEWRTTWPGVEVRILSSAGTPMPVGEDGLIYVRPAGGRRFHYHGDEKKTAAAWQDDAFTVGDIGHVDADGYLYITDRANDMVLWGGVNIYPREIEEVLHRHRAVVDCAVFGVPDDRYGEVIKAVVELRTPVDEESLRSHVRDRLADFKVPTYISIVDTLPRDPNGKVLKRLLREEHQKAGFHG